MKRGRYRSESKEDRKYKRRREKRRSPSSSGGSSKYIDTDSWTYDSSSSSSKKSKDSFVKEKPCFEPSGILLEYYGNKKNGIILKFTEPIDAAVPDPKEGDKEWCFFEFVNEEIVNEGKDAMALTGGKSVFLFGRDPEVCDFAL